MQSCLIIPCHNEAHRLDRKAVEAFIQSTPTIDLMMVDDGSVDSTAEVLQALKSTTSDRLHVLCLASNQGKAEAVRAGVQAALALNRFDVVGFCDADLATPLSEMGSRQKPCDTTSLIFMMLHSRRHVSCWGTQNGYSIGVISPNSRNI